MGFIECVACFAAAISSSNLYIAESFYLSIGLTAISWIDALIDGIIVVE